MHAPIDRRCPPRPAARPAGRWHRCLVTPSSLRVRSDGEPVYSAAAPAALLDLVAAGGSAGVRRGGRARRERGGVAGRPAHLCPTNWRCWKSWPTQCPVARAWLGLAPAAGPPLGAVTSWRARCERPSARDPARTLLLERCVTEDRPDLRQAAPAAHRSRASGGPIRRWWRGRPWRWGREISMPPFAEVRGPVPDGPGRAGDRRRSEGPRDGAQVALSGMPDARAGRWTTTSTCGRGTATSRWTAR